MDSEYHRKLVDLYAGRELPSELESDMEAAALNDADLAVEMKSLRDTVDTLKSEDSPFTEESYQRILQKLIVRSGQFAPRSPDPAHLQYQLPIQG